MNSQHTVVVRLVLVGSPKAFVAVGNDGLTPSAVLQEGQAPLSLAGDLVRRVAGVSPTWARPRIVDARAADDGVRLTYVAVVPDDLRLPLDTQWRQASEATNNTADGDDVAAALRSV